MAKIIPMQQRRGRDAGLVGSSGQGRQGRALRPDAQKSASRTAPGQGAQKNVSRTRPRRGAQNRALRTAPQQERKVVEVEKRVQYKPAYDYTILILLVGLLAFGLVMVYSSSYYVSEVKGESQAYYFLKQLLCVAIGTVAMLACMSFDYHKFIALSYDARKLESGQYKNRPLLSKPYIWVLLLSVVTLGLVFTPLGVDINGSRRWINVGISIQPSEIVKIGLILYVACSLGEDPRRMRNFWNGLCYPYLVILLAICAIIFFQPNFSAIVCISLLMISMLFAGGAKKKYVWSIIAVAVVFGTIFMVMKPYRVKRLFALFNPDNSWQLKQSLYSIGAGGLFGRGLGNSMQKLLYLPYRESDFIFAIIAEETGLFGCLVLLGMFALLIWRGVLTAINAPDLTGMLIATGTTAALGIQVCVNIMVNIGLCPPTGVVLPFISYGGSGVVIFMAMMGLLLNVSRYGSAPISAKRGGRLFAVVVPAEDGTLIRGLDEKKKRRREYEIEQKKRAKRRRRPH